MSGLDEKGRYCTCNSKTNPCIVCGKPKFIDPEWLKRKIEEEPDGMEVGAGFEIFSTLDTVAATPADVGEEPVAWRTRGMNVLSRWMPWVMVDKVQAERWREDPSFRNGRREVEPLYSATALERVTRERDEARIKIGDMEASYANSLQEMSERFRAVNIAKVIEQSGVNFISLAARAESAEAEVARLRKVVERAKETRFYIDCEFDGHDGPLLTIAVVGEDDANVYLVATDQDARDPWVVANVIPLIDRHIGHRIDVPLAEFGHALRKFLGGVEHPVIIADSPVDIGRFCRALSTGRDGGWSSADFARLSFEVHNVDVYPTTLAAAVQHNAWWDAMALREHLRAARQFDEEVK